jgi:NAD(P)-dependent dehydrogenase (short-subunit alcohol dehydrogenase family)
VKTLFRLDGKVALVTGAANGVGAATAKILTMQGAQVALVDIDDEGLDRVSLEIGEAARIYHRDVSRVEECRALPGKVVEDFGRLDILVNNAAICPRLSFADANEVDWDRLMDTNAKSQYFLMQAVSPILKKQGGGRIINITSTGGRIGSFANASIYSGSKGAIAMFSKSVARELASDNILVNCIAPGVLDTQIMWNLSEERIKEICEQIPLKRLGSPQEVAMVVAFLCSDECSYATGATFDVNGGWIML